MAIARCPRCQTENQPELTGAFCRHCGALLPGMTGPAAGVTLTPAIISSPESERRHELIGLRDQQRFARNSVAALLFALAVLQLLCGCTDLILNPDLTKGMDAQQKQTVLLVTSIVVTGTTMLLAGLGALALYQPFPAAVVGLLVWAAITVVVVVLTPEAICKVAAINGPLLIALGQGVYASHQAFYKQPTVQESDLQ